MGGILSMAGAIPLSKPQITIIEIDNDLTGDLTRLARYATVKANTANPILCIGRRIAIPFAELRATSADNGIPARRGHPILTTDTPIGPYGVCYILIDDIGANPVAN
jgi:hypothetical protein